MQVTYNINLIIMYMLSISYPEDGLFLQLQINILLKYI